MTDGPTRKLQPMERPHRLIGHHLETLLHPTVSYTVVLTLKAFYKRNPALKTLLSSAKPAMSKSVNNTSTYTTPTQNTASIQPTIEPSLSKNHPLHPIFPNKLLKNL
ncbi:hypothetical protein RF11_07162 [Thelohanellus kitauei]|uniref:Uncharacterized protein n=1 Tax=Thelohanellus kitauei TaxID=669202 RepID=A0A0C2J1J1_THEKT|nr:hypothetical protein RF11_07162 [Thelohanellus kitauei]